MTEADIEETIKSWSDEWKQSVEDAAARRAPKEPTSKGKEKVGDKRKNDTDAPAPKPPRKKVKIQKAVKET